MPRRCGAGCGKQGYGEGNGGGNPIGSGAKRKAHFGELVQMDGSFHEWLEERGPRGCLMHMVDDATTDGAGLVHGGGNDLGGGARCCGGWIERYGVPQALYTDWKNVYVRPPNAAGADARRSPAVTQFGRMCAKLGIRDHRRQFAASQRASGAGARHASGSAGEEAATGWDRQLRPGQCLSGRALSRRTQPALRARPAAAAADYHRRRPDGAATGPSVLAGGRTSGK